MPYVAESPALLCPPRIRIAPVGADCAWGDAAIELANAYVLPLYDWQQDVERCWLARRPDGRYACSTCVLIVPRQNGKSKGIVVTRILFGAMVLGETIRYSAHRVDTMMEIFDIVVDILGDPRLPEDEWDDPALARQLHPRVKKFRFDNGHLKIEFKNGGFIRFVSRATGAGRGSTVDVNVYDEAQYLTEDQVASALPNQSAGPKKNPQKIYLGTPPSEPGCLAIPFSNVRKAAMERKPRRCLHEYSVEEMGDITDRSRWYATNPSMGLSLMEEAVEDEVSDLGPVKFAIERLCWWPRAVSNKAIDAAKWDELASEGPDDADIVKKAIGIKFSPDGMRCCMAIATKTSKGAHVELLADVFALDDGVTELVDWIVERKGSIAFVAVDGKSGGQDFVDRLHDARMPKKAARLMTTSEVVAAATKLVSMVTDRSLTHFSDEGLDASAKGATKRKIGVDGYGFGGESCPIEAAANAVWGVMTTKRDPARKMRVLL